jgi:transketolase
VSNPVDERRGEQVQEVRDRAATVRRETVRLVGIAKSGHYSSVFSCAEIMAALYSGVMRIAEDPEWPERDRLILSKGHVAIGLYPLLAERGYFPAEWLDSYTRLGSPLGDHPDMRLIPGVDFSSGSLGHGLSVGVGMAKAARLRGYDETRVWVMLGDQELNEGQVWEAAGSASHFGLGNLVAIVDANQMGLDGMTEETMSVEPIAGRFEAFGWDVVEIDGHDPEAILAAAAALPPATSDQPRCILARTVKGKGVSYMELSRTWHIGYLSPEDSAAAVAEIDQRG